jgi:hypothetical protein
MTRDILCIFLGGNVPFILRPLGDGSYELVGEAYVHGVMDGEFMTENVKPEPFYLS